MISFVYTIWFIRTDCFVYCLLFFLCTFREHALNTRYRFNAQCSFDCNNTLVCWNEAALKIFQVEYNAHYSVTFSRERAHILCVRCNLETPKEMPCAVMKSHRPPRRCSQKVIHMIINCVSNNNNYNNTQHAKCLDDDICHRSLLGRMPTCPARRNCQGQNRICVVRARNSINNSFILHKLHCTDTGYVVTRSKLRMNRFWLFTCSCYYCSIVVCALSLIRQIMHVKWAIIV